MKNYKWVITFLFIMQLSSVSKLTEYVESKITSYKLLVAHSIFSRYTRINWQYGFFTAKEKHYSYLSSDLILLSSDSKKPIKYLTRNGDLSVLVKRPNDLRVNTLMQHLVRDSFYMDIASRSIALYFFQRNPGYNGLVFRVKSIGCKICEDDNIKFKITRDTGYIFNKLLSF